MKKQTIYFVTGTISLFAVKKLNKLNENYMIILENKNLLKFISEFNFKKSKVKTLNNFFIIKNFELFIIIAYLKIKKYEIKFFHNAYWPFFDFSVNLFKINGTQYITTFQDWSGKHKFNKKVQNVFKLKKLSFLKKIRFFLLLNFLYKNHELFFRKSFSSIKENILFFTNCKFHKGISTKLVYKDNLKKNNLNKLKINLKKKILLLPTKKYPPKFIITKKLFNYIVKILIHTNHEIYFKDHPTDSSSIDLSKFIKLKKINIIQREKLIENINIDFDLVIGFTSTGLIYYNEKAISLVKFYGKSDYIIQKKYFDMNGSTLINYPKNFMEIKKLLKL